MATRNIVPRANEEGGIGTSIKKWLYGYIKTLAVTTINALTLTTAAIGFSITGGTTPKTLTVANNATVGGNAINPTLPAFLGVSSFDQSDLPLNTPTEVIFVEQFDQGGNFASNVFTAPVTGKYQLSLTLVLKDIDSAATFYQILIITTKRSIALTIDTSKFSADINYFPFSFSVLADMDAGNTAKVQVAQYAGTQQTDILAGSAFSGYLVA